MIVGEKERGKFGSELKCKTTIVQLGSAGAYVSGRISEIDVPVDNRICGRSHAV
jgi:hypothetical protein